MKNYKTSIPSACLTGYTLIAFFIVLVLSSCGMSIQGEAGLLAEETRIKSPSSENWEAASDTLAARIEQTIVNERSNIRSANSRLATSGGIVSFIGAVSASVISSTSNDNTKTVVGLIGSILSASVGMYQVWVGKKKDAAEYVRDASEVISFGKADMSAATDEVMKQEAYVSFLRETGRLQARYPGFANIRIADLR